MTDSKTFNLFHGGIDRTIKIAIGSHYKFEPANIQKAPKNRGRTCTAMGFRSYPSHCKKNAAERVRVKWHDTNRFGYVEPCDLIQTGR